MCTLVLSASCRSRQPSLRARNFQFDDEAIIAKHAGDRASVAGAPRRRRAAEREGAEGRWAGLGQGPLPRREVLLRGSSILRVLPSPTVAK